MSLNVKIFIIGKVDRCKYFLLCKPIRLILSCVIVVIVIIVIIIIVYGKKLWKSQMKVCRLFTKSTEQNGKEEPLLNGHEENRKEINFNDLAFENCIKIGRFSTIYRGRFSNKQVAIKHYSNNERKEQNKSSFDHEQQIYSLPFMEYDHILQ